MRSTATRELWLARYEALRQHALSGITTLATPPLGLWLLRQQGVAGWMERWTEAVEGCVTTVTRAASALLGAAEWPRQPLTLLLAQMTLQQIQPVRTP
jgi:hypothetical protein